MNTPAKKTEVSFSWPRKHIVKFIFLSELWHVYFISAYSHL